MHTPGQKRQKQNCGWVTRMLTLIALVLCATEVGAIVIQDGGLTPLQLRIERQRVRLSAAEEEERRDAVSQLGAMKHPDASRAAVAALSDASASVRATAASSILALSGEEGAGKLIPLLSDKDEFVRREAAYALGKTRSRSAVAPLLERLLLDKEDGVRGAAAVALGDIADPSAVATLAAVMKSEVVIASNKKNSKSKKEQNPFVLRAVARSLGQTGNREGVPALISTLENEKTDDDVSREAAKALGLIGDTAALPSLRNALTARDPYLSKVAQEAITAIEKPKG